MHSHNHTSRQLWFPQVAALSLQREDLSGALFNTDVKIRTAHGTVGGGRSWFLTEMFARPDLIDRETSSQFNPSYLIEHLLNDQVVTQLNLNSYSCLRCLWGQSGFCIWICHHFLASCWLFPMQSRTTLTGAKWIHFRLSGSLCCLKGQCRQTSL